MKLTSEFKRHCEAIAIDWRHRLRLKFNDPLTANQLLFELKGEAITPIQLPNASPGAVHRLMTNSDWSAGIVRLEPLLIVYHPLHSPARHQSNLMHEIAHILLEHPMVSFDSITGLPMRDPRCEDEATYLGSCLQIPRLGLEWMVKKGYNIIQIATHFGASESMVRFRCNMTGIRLNSEELEF